MATDRALTQASLALAKENQKKETKQQTIENEKEKEKKSDNLKRKSDPSSQPAPMNFSQSTNITDNFVIIDNNPNPQQQEKDKREVPDKQSIIEYIQLLQGNHILFSSNPKFKKNKILNNHFADQLYKVFSYYITDTHMIKGAHDSIAKYLQLMVAELDTEKSDFYIKNHVERAAAYYCILFALEKYLNGKKSKSFSSLLYDNVFNNAQYTDKNNNSKKIFNEDFVNIFKLQFKQSINTMEKLLEDPLPLNTILSSKTKLPEATFKIFKNKLSEESDDLLSQKNEEKNSNKPLEDNFNNTQHHTTTTTVTVVQTYQQQNNIEPNKPNEESKDSDSEEKDDVGNLVDNAYKTISKEGEEEENEQKLKYTSLEKNQNPISTNNNISSFFKNTSNKSSTHLPSSQEKEKNNNSSPSYSSSSE